MEGSAPAIFTSLAILLFSNEFALAKEKPYSVELKESYSPSVNVSGQLLVGLQVPTNSPKGLGNTLYIYKPLEIKEFKLRVYTIDGVYAARSTITFNEDISGWYPVFLDTEHQDKLKQYEPHEIQAYLYKQQKDPKTNKSRHIIFPTSWGIPSKKPASFYVNSTGVEPQYVFKSEGNVIRVMCSELTNKIKTSFTHECKWNEGLSSQKEQNGSREVLFKSGNGRNKKYLVWEP
ncbi:hypothetical protein [Vibrio alfacsensis]|uniref:hypothetical protein n=1 Tax=Vibrio TaxID=662 RepID=UPI004068C6B8